MLEVLFLPPKFNSKPFPFNSPAFTSLFNLRIFKLILFKLVLYIKELGADEVQGETIEEGINSSTISIIYLVIIFKSTSRRKSIIIIVLLIGSILIKRGVRIL